MTINEIQGAQIYGTYKPQENDDLLDPIQSGISDYQVGIDNDSLIDGASVVVDAVSELPSLDDNPEGSEIVRSVIEDLGRDIKLAPDEQDQLSVILLDAYRMITSE